MSDVTFEEEASLVRSAPAASKARGLVGALVNAGIAKTEGGANILLLSIAGIVFLAAGYFFIAGNPSRPMPTAEDRAEFEALKRNGLAP